MFHGACQRERVGRDDAIVALELDERVGIKIFRIDDGAIDVGEQLKFV